MRNERDITSENTKHDKAWEDYVIQFIPILNTGLITLLNTAGASLGEALLKQFAPTFSPKNTQTLLASAACSTTIGFMLIGLLCATFSTPSHKKNPRERLYESLKILYQAACANMMLSFALPILSAYFIFNQNIIDSTEMGIATSIGANAISIPLMISAMLFAASKHCIPAEKKDGIAVGINTEQPGHTVITVQSALERDADQQTP